MVCTKFVATGFHVEVWQKGAKTDSFSFGTLKHALNQARDLSKEKADSPPAACHVFAVVKTDLSEYWTRIALFSEGQNIGC